MTEWKAVIIDETNLSDAFVNDVIFVKFRVFDPTAAMSTQNGSGGGGGGSGSGGEW